MRIPHEYPYGYDSPTFCSFCGDVIEGKEYELDGMVCCKWCYDSMHEEEDEEDDDYI